MSQVQLDIGSLERATCRLFWADKAVIQQVQTASYQQVFLVSGMTHPKFLETLQALSPRGYDRIAKVAQTLS